MNVHGVGHSIGISHIPKQNKPTPPEAPESEITSPPISDAVTTNISEEAKSQSQHSGKAKPREVAEALGVKNFGQALKVLRKAGVDLSHGFVSALVHGDEGALAKAKAALAPSPEEATESASNSEAPSEQPIDPTPKPLDTVPLPASVPENPLPASITA